MKRVLLLFILTPFFFSCTTIGPIAELMGEIGYLSDSQVDSISKSAEAGAKATEDITPSEEYYIGRSLGAIILSQYSVYNDTKSTEYLNKIGQLLSLNSSRPETFGGYHILILDSDEINAFAAPSGHIFISKGLIKLTENEDELAAIIAHEISHVVLQHGLEAIKKSRVTSFVTILGSSALKEFGSKEIAELTTLFEDSLADITSTLINSGYSRKFELEADLMTIDILRRTGYDVYALSKVLKNMSKVLTPNGLDFAKTHPDPEDRLENLKEEGDINGFGKKIDPNRRFIENLRNL